MLPSSRSRKSSADADDADGRQGPLEQTFLSSAEAPRMRKINHLGVIPAGYELGGILFGYWKKLSASTLSLAALPFARVLRRVRELTPMTQPAPRSQRARSS